MVSTYALRGTFFLLGAVALLMVAAPALAAHEEGPEDITEGAASEEPTDMAVAVRAVGLALGAAIAIAGAGFATAKAQAAVGAGGTGAIAEKPETATFVLFLFAIPETIIVLGFVIALLLVLAI